MLQVEILVCESFRAVYAYAARTVSIEEISALAHEARYLARVSLYPLLPPNVLRTYYSVELGALVALRSAHGILGLASAELTEVLRRFWNYIFEKLKGNST
jgi:hypothetical protein